MSFKIDVVEEKTGATYNYHTVIGGDLGLSRLPLMNEFGELVLDADGNLVDAGQSASIVIGSYISQAYYYEKQGSSECAGIKEVFAIPYMTIYGWSTATNDSKSLYEKIEDEIISQSAKFAGAIKVT